MQKVNRSWRTFQKQLGKSALRGFEVLKEQAYKDKRCEMGSSSWQNETECWQSHAVIPYWIQGKSNKKVKCPRALPCALSLLSPISTP